MKYPSAIKKTTVKMTSHANRGMSLENDLNITNTYYVDSNIAIIYKKPTPIRIVKVAFDANKNATIKEAYFKQPSTTDYNGIYKGRYIDFEAKEARGKTFPIININTHQIKHIKVVMEHGGISFVIVRFSTLNKTFILKGEDLISLLNDEIKSIPLAIFENMGYLIEESYIPRLNYIKIIDDIYFGGSK